MQISYDPRYNIAYIYLRSKKEKGVTTLRLSEELLLDIAPDGTLYGLELLNAQEQLCDLEKKGITITNEATGRTKEIYPKEMSFQSKEAPHSAYGGSSTPRGRGR